MLPKLLDHLTAQPKQLLIMHLRQNLRRLKPKRSKHELMPVMSHLPNNVGQMELKKCLQNSKLRVKQVSQYKKSNLILRPLILLIYKRVLLPDREWVWRMLSTDQWHFKRLLTVFQGHEQKVIRFGLYGLDSPIPMQNLEMKANMTIAGVREPKIQKKKIKKKRKKNKKMMIIIKILKKNMDFLEKNQYILLYLQ